MTSQQFPTGESWTEPVLDRLRADPALAFSAGVGGVLFVVAWTSYGWSLPSTVEEAVALATMVGVVGGLLMLVGLLMLAPRAFAWRVLGSRVPNDQGRIEDQTP